MFVVVRRWDIDRMILGLELVWLSECYVYFVCVGERVAWHSCFFVLIYSSVAWCFLLTVFRDWKIVSFFICYVGFCWSR